jgi:hypothetical protein
MTIEEAFEIVKLKYKDGDFVQCLAYDDSPITIGGYIIRPSINLKIDYSNAIIRCYGEDTAYVILYEQKTEHFAKMITEKKTSDFNKKPHIQEIKDELQKYQTIGTIIGALQSNNTVLDNQLRQFKKQNDNNKN